MKKTIQLLFGLTALSLVSFANPAPKKVKEATYKVDTQQSKLAWTAKKVTGEHSGTAPISTGSLALESGKLKGGSFDIDLKDLTVTDITDAAQNAKLVGHLKSDDFFSVERHPTARFVISSVSLTGNNTYDVTGKLTIKGITNDIKFPAQVKTEAGKLTATANVTVDRTKYDIKYRSKNYFENLGDKTIYDDFTLAITLVATPSGAVASR
ncbi:YceI family protein [Spirosoma sp. KCTC 42546]|uniref:YceI family protein n=1 Tax=Spirosoma sp. KCTC 42546 TaxID=2520506 RepID=UPI0011578B6C|nr:YceI family protein [Spirosoma sp. KCTC 42546]QDK81084.1 YceI family protein [Spirosoma sp. KCTC 42546]